MSNYTQEELEGMSRVQLRRTAIETLKIDNKEASNSKSGDLISRIMEVGSGEEEPPKKAAAAAAKRGTSKRASSRKSGGNGVDAAATSTESVAVPTNGISKLVDAVGKAVDETKEELVTKVDGVLDQLDHIMKQQFILFGLLCDVYKNLDEPDVLEARLEELDEEWNAQGNEG